MGEMARKRSARDLWVSRGHLASAAVFCVFVAIGAYALGYYTAQNQDDDVTSSNRDLDPKTASVVELLDRIEGSVVDPTGQETLTYPKVLVDELTMDSPSNTSSASSKNLAWIKPGAVKGPLVVVGDVVRGELALQFALRQMKVGKLVGRQFKDEKHAIVVAGFGTIAEAQDYIESVKNDYSDLNATYEIRGQ